MTRASRNKPRFSHLGAFPARNLNFLINCPTGLQVYAGWTFEIRHRFPTGLCLSIDIPPKLPTLTNLIINNVFRVPGVTCTIDQCEVPNRLLNRGTPLLHASPDCRLYSALRSPLTTQRPALVKELPNFCVFHDSVSDGSSSYS